MQIVRMEEERKKQEGESWCGRLDEDRNKKGRDRPSSGSGHGSILPVTSETGPGGTTIIPGKMLLSNGRYDCLCM